MSGVLVDRAKAQGEARVRALAVRIAKESPTLADLPAEELERLARVVMAERLRDELKRATDVERLDYPGERKRFLEGLRSAHTRRAYSASLDRLDAYAARIGIPVAALGAAQADDWIVELRGTGRSPASIRLDVNAASAFFSWLERRHAELRNPFRGTRERPPLRSTRELAVPSTADVRAILAALDGDVATREAVRVMAELGLRVGGLPAFSIRGDRWATSSKGKELTGPTAETRERFRRVRSAIRAAGLPLRAPFGELTATVLADRVRRVTVRLAASDKIAAPYSVHDLRHHFAVGFYKATRDIYALRRALGHAGVGVTERYLRAIGLSE